MTIYVSDKLQATAATVSGDPTPTTSWQWLRNSSAISGATSSDYVVSADDVGASISVIQSAINMLGTATATSASDGPVLPFLPSLLFRNAATKGVWYDPSDFTRYMSSLGPELVTNGDFSAGTTGWAIGINGTVTVSSGVLTLTNGSFGFQRITQGFATTVGKTYRINCTNLSGNSRYSVSSANDYGQNVLAAQSVSGAMFTATTTTSYIVLSCYTANNGDTATFDNISVRELTAIGTATLFQDAAGTTPATAVEQPVGLMLDKSKGLVLGPELVTNGDFTSSANWTTGSGWTISGGKLTATSVAFGVETKQTIASLVSGSRYAVTFDVVVTSGSLKVNLGDLGVSSTELLITATGTYTYRPIQSGTAQITFWAASTFTGTIDNVSVKLVPGNHAFNSSGNSANFPVLSARYNLLTKTEDFTAGGPWSLGTGVSVSNQKTITFTSGGMTEFVRQLYSFVSGITYTILIRAKSVSGNTTLSVDLENAQGVTDMILTTEFQVFQRQITPSAARSWMDIQLGGGGVVQIDYIDLRVANDALNQPAYQRVNTATDYDTVGFKPYLKFNGTNQWLQTNSIDFTATDKMFVSAGVRKLSDAAAGVVGELSTSFGSIGSVAVYAPSSVGSASYTLVSTGTLSATATSSATYAAPTTNVVSGIGNISGDQSILRVNGAQAAISTSDQGTGNYGNYPLYIGARAGSSVWFNGRLYSLIVAGKLANAVEITETEKYVNGKTAAY